MSNVTSFRNDYTFKIGFVIIKDNSIKDESLLQPHEILDEEFKNKYIPKVKIIFDNENEIVTFEFENTVDHRDYNFIISYMKYYFKWVNIYYVKEIIIELRYNKQLREHIGARYMSYGKERDYEKISIQEYYDNNPGETGTFANYKIWCETKVNSGVDVTDTFLHFKKYNKFIFKFIKWLFISKTNKGTFNKKTLLH